MKLKGTITVFLSLILIIVLSLITAVIESAEVAAIRARTEMVMDMGLESVFAEYNRELLNKYDLYFIDTAYGTGNPSISNTGEHLRSYMEYNFEPAKGTMIFNSADLMGIKIKKAEILSASYATDYCGRVFKRQAIQAIEDIYGISAAKTMAEKTKKLGKIYEDSGIENYDAEKRQQELEEKLSDIEYKIPENPAAHAFDDKSGMLGFILEDRGSISDKTFNLCDLVSHRTINEGIGMIKPTEDPDSVLNELLFDEYLGEKCSCYTDNNGHKAMAYELEYILNGKNTDKANLRETVNKIMIIRYASDAMFILSNDKRKNEIKPVIEIITALLLLPDAAAEVLTDLILMGWAYGESVSDVKRLLAGEKVPIVKNEDDWKTGLADLIDIKHNTHATGSSGEGISYGQYLKIFLTLEDKTTKCMRAMDVIELNIRQSDGNHDFRIDGCAEYVDAYAEIKAKDQYEYSIERKYSYMTD